VHRCFVRIAVLLLATIPSCWADTSFGTWVLNPARSTFAGEAEPKSLTVRIEPHAKGEVFTLDRIEADGRTTSSSTILYLDGMSRDFKNFECSGIQSSRRVDGQTVEILRKCAGGEWSRFIRRSGARQADLILEITGRRSDGRFFEQRLVLEQQSKSGIAQYK
jgi:hypothetical protein